MEEFLLEMLKQYGISGVVLVILLYDKFLKPKVKKQKGDWVDYKDIIRLTDRFDVLSTRFEEHLKSEAAEDIERGQMKIKLEAIEKHQESENRHLFNQLESVWHKLDELTQDVRSIVKDVRNFPAK